MRESLKSLLKKRPDLENLMVDVPDRTVHLNFAKGDRVTVRRGQENPIQDAERMFIVEKIVEKAEGDFCQLRAHDGTGPHRWYRSSDLMPAPSSKEQPMSNAMETEQQLHAEADRFEMAVNARIAKGERPDDALLGEAADDPVRAEIYRRSKTGSPVFTSSPVISLSVRSGENFDQLAERYATENKCSLRQAIHDVGRAFPQLAEAR
jgi:hypothetical protein